MGCKNAAPFLRFQKGCAILCCSQGGTAGLVVLLGKNNLSCTAFRKELLICFRSQKRYLLTSDLNVKFQNRADLKNTWKNGYFLNQHYLTKSFRLINWA